MIKDLEVAVAKHYGNTPSWKQLYTAVFVSIIISCMISLAGCSAIFFHMINDINDTHSIEMTELRESLTDDADKRVEEVTSSKDTIIESLKDDLRKVKDGLSESNAALSSLRYSYDMLVTRGAIELDELKELWYVFRDIDSGSGLTPDMIMYSVDQCRQMNVDPNLMWLIFMVEMESSKNNNNKVSADITDMARILPSTGKDLWEKYLGYGEESFNRAILDSPYNRIRLAIAHIARDLDDGRTVIYAIDHYFGGNGRAFYGQIARLARAYCVQVEDVTPVYGPTLAQLA